MTWIICLLYLWLSPVVAFLIIRLTRNNLPLQNRILIALIVLSAVTLVAIALDLSTTLQTLDWLLLANIYLTLCVILFRAIKTKILILKIFVILVMVSVFGMGYFSSTIGALGVGFVTQSFEPRKETWLSDGIIVKELSIGNAISRRRGARIEVFKAIPWLPFVERLSLIKEYDDIIVMYEPIKVTYNANLKLIILQLENRFIAGSKKNGFWSDSISLKCK